MRTRRDAIRPLALVAAVAVALGTLTACTAKDDESSTLHVLAGSEVKDMRQRKVI